MKYIWLCFVAICMHTFAAAQPFTIAEIKQGENYLFPIFSSDTNPAVAQKINIHLQLGELEQLGSDSTIFETISRNDGSLYGAKVAVLYTLHANNNRVLSVSFSESADGMTTHYWNNYHTFNAANGTRISLKELFSRDGYIQMINYAVERILKTYIKENTEAWCVDAIKQMICFGVGQLANEPDFFISGDSLYIDNTDCLPKAYMSCGHLRAGFSATELRLWLSAYGKAALLGEADMKGFVSKKLPQLMTGMIGDYPIYLLLRLQPTATDMDVQGVYAYVSKGIGIRMTGNLQGTQLQLTEYKRTPIDTPGTRFNEETEEYADITGTLIGATLTGTWKDKAGKIYNISASQAP